MTQVNPEDTVPRRVRFGEWQLDLQTGELRKNGAWLRLQEQPFQVLSVLLERPGEVVSREELIRRLWGEGTHVDFDRGLNAAVTRLRQVLSDSAETPKFVETVARRGYRFIGVVETEPHGSAPARVPTGVGRRLRWWWVGAGALALTIGTVALRFNSSPEQPTGSVRLIPLTTYPGYESRGSLSPDGRQLVFDWTREPGDTRVFIKLVGIGDPVRLTSAEAVEFNAVWSPDGREIAFLRLESPGRIGVYTTPHLGGTERRLAGFPVSWDMNLSVPFYSSLLTWSPDARWLVAVAGEGFSTGLLLVSTVTGEAKWLRPPPGEAGQGDVQPAFSPDGRTLAFVRRVAAFAGDVFVAPFNTSGTLGQSRRITKDLGPVIGGMAWMRDGKSLLFTNNRLVRRLYRVDVSQPGEPVALTEPGAAMQPQMTAGGALVFSRSTADRNIWRRQIPQRHGPAPNPEKLIASTMRDSNPHYSPDGTRIAFQSTRSGTFQIWTCDSSSGARCVQVTRGLADSHVGTPRWSPDGAHIVFDASPSGNFDVFVVNAGGGEAKRLTDHPADDACPSVSRDGRHVYFYSQRSGKSQIWRTDMEGGAPVQITEDEGWCAFESPDGNWLFYSRGNAGPGLQSIWRKPLTTRGEDQMVVKKFYAAARAWAVGAERIWYIAPAGAMAELRSVDLRTGADVLVDTVAPPNDMGLSVSPDGRFIVYSQTDNPGSDLVLIENFR